MSKTKIMSKAEQFPLVAEGYDILDCPHCNTQCYPDAKRADGTVVYEKHKCQSPFANWGQQQMASFEINSDGEFVE